MHAIPPEKGALSTDFIIKCITPTDLPTFLNF